MTDETESSSSSYPLITCTKSGRTYQSASSISNNDFTFLDLLGLAQNLGIDFLPIRWQPELEMAGQGGTAQIYQSMINIQVTFAFKRLKVSESEEVKARNLSALLAEIAILGHPAIRNHAHVVSIEGICFDVVQEEERVSPVLVFEKTACGDLAKFMTEGAGRELTIDARLALLTDIALAIRDLHTLGVIHGDVKPENVLVFLGIEKRYRAKVTDFGYSTLFSSDEGLVTMPFSGVWTAPEHHHRYFTHLQAMKMDFYSFGMLSLWLLFYYQLTMNEWYSMQSSYRKLDTLDQALRLLEEFEGIDNLRPALQALFGSTLVSDPEERRTDFSNLLHVILRDTTEPAALVPNAVRTSSTDFRLLSSFYQLIRAHYAVRQYIARCLEDRINQSRATLNQKLSLALCYDLGFGVIRDQTKFNRLLLNEPGLLKTYRSQAIQATSDNADSPNDPHTLYETLHRQGFIEAPDHSSQYEDEGLLGEAESLFRREIKTLRVALGDIHYCVQELRRQLSNLLQLEGRSEETVDILQQMRHLDLKIANAPSQFDVELAIALDTAGRYEEAEELLIGFQEAFEKNASPQHLSMALVKSAQASISSHQGRWQEAEELETQVIETWTGIFGPDHPSTMVSMSNLVSRYRHHQRWSDAEVMDLRIIDRLKRVQGAKHEDTVMRIAELAAIYRDQERWSEAEQLEAQVMKSSVETLGSKHPSTVASMANLARTYFYQRRWNEAEQLQTQVIEVGSQILGKGHHDVLSTMDNLDITYLYLKQWAKSEEVQRQAIEWRTEYLGADHIETVESKDSLDAFLKRKDMAKDGDDLYKYT